MEFQLNMVISADGKISLEAEMPMQMDVHYEKKGGFRSKGFHVSVEDPKLTANCDADLLLRAEAIPTILKLDIGKVLDAELDFGVNAKAETVARTSPEMLCVDAKLAFPVTYLHISDDADVYTMLDAWGLSWDKELVTPERAPIQAGLHFEYCPEGKSGFVDACTYKKEKAETKGIGEIAPLDWNRFYGYKLPLAFCTSYTEEGNGKRNYSITDKGTYYLLEGTLLCPEYIETEIVAQAGKGEQIETGSGHKYTVVKTESYNEDQRERMILLGEDGKSYEIADITGFMLYKGTPCHEIMLIEGGSAKRCVTAFENVELKIDKNTQVSVEGEIEEDGMVTGYGIQNYNYADWYQRCLKLMESPNYDMETSFYHFAYDISFGGDGTIQIDGSSDYLIDEKYAYYTGNMADRIEICK